ncbi:MAG TPA: hypothetical protein VHC22_27860 [Pirellulales bacterium]|nr:hypothetical protein [Pirellulales bacterium]
MIARFVAQCQARPKAVLAACALLLALQIGPWWYSSVDSTAYLSMARSLARGTGPTNLGSPLLWYSPGYPLLLSPLFMTSERPFVLIAVFQWLLAVGLMLGVYRWGKRVEPRAALWLAALTVVNHGFCIHFRRPLSEAAFMCVLVWSINLLGTLTGTMRTPRFAFRLAGCAVLLALVSAIRPVGIMLAPAFALWALREARECRWGWLRAIAATLVVAAGAAAPVALFVHHERALAAQLGGRSYADNFHDAARSPLESYSRGLQLCISDIGRVCIPGFFKTHAAPGDWTDPNMVIHVPFFVLVCLGWWRWRGCANDLYAWYVPFYLLLIAAHAMDTGARLLLPLLPALLACAWFALQGTGERRRYVAAACLVVQLIVAGGYWLGVDLPRARRFGRQWPAVDNLVARITADPRPVVAMNLPGELERMLELALDHPVLRDDDGTNRPCWIVTARGSDLSADGFVPRHTAGELALWR